MLMDPTAVAGRPHEASFASQLSELEAREAEITKNLKSLDTGAKTAAIGEELLVIQEKRLYQAAGLKSFKRYLDSGRNGMSRSRAYQLINLAKYRRTCLAKGAPLPASERQARRILKERKLELSDDFDLEQPVWEHLANGFEAWPQPVQADFARYLLDLATEFVEGKENGPWERSLVMLAHLRRTYKAGGPNYRSWFAKELLAAAKDFRTAAERERRKSITPSGQTVQPPTDVNGCVEPRLPPISVNSKDNSGALERSSPLGKAGPVMGISMDEARRRGYVK